MLLAYSQAVAQMTEAFPVSLPRAAMHCEAATAAADPPEDPPGTLSMSCGLHVTCNQITTRELDKSMAYSVQVAECKNIWRGQ